MRLRRSLVVLLVFAVGLAAGSFVSDTLAAFSATTQNSGNSFSASADWEGPSASAAVVRKAAGGVEGYIKAGGGYFVYASVTDSGNPATGVSSVTTNVSAITSGQTAAAMSSGSWTVGGVSYNYRTAQLTANAVLVDGSKSFSIGATDAGSNSKTTSGFTVTVDNVVPAGTDIQASNTSGGTAGRAEEGDTVVYTFTEQIEPDSILAGWNGSSTNVVLRFNNSAGNDTVQIWNAANTSQLPLGQINTQGDYVKASITYGASGTPSTMVQTGSSITITLRTVSDATQLKTNGLDTQLWTPASAATDLAGNNCDITLVNELGDLDADF